jgi:phage terminase large subunit
MTQLEIKHSGIFLKNFDAYKENYKFIVNTGGSRSSKSFSILQLLIYLCMTEPNLKISIVRASLPSLRKSIMMDFFKLLRDYNLYKENNHQKTENHYKFDNGSMVEFFGVTDGQRIRGAKRDILFCNEGNELSLEAFNQLMMRTTKCCFIDRNPSEIDHWIDDILKDGKAINIHSTYKDNPFLPKSQVDYIESMINIDPNYYRIYALGLAPTDNVRIYSHFKKYSELPQYREWCYGLDFGFSHKTALVKCFFTDDNRIFVQEMLYESNMTSGDIVQFIKEHIRDKQPIFCDSARPDMIEELKRYGLNAKSSDKDVKGGISCLRSKEIYIEVNSNNLWNEYRSYTWKTDNNGKATDQPIKLNDDLMDAMRYAIYTYKGKSVDIMRMRFY